MTDVLDELIAADDLRPEPRSGSLKDVSPLITGSSLLGNSSEGNLVAGARFVPNLDTLCIPFRSELIHCAA